MLRAPGLLRGCKLDMGCEWMGGWGYGVVREGVVGAVGGW
jgi:hypothetical protein